MCRKAATVLHRAAFLVVLCLLLPACGEERETEAPRASDPSLAVVVGEVVLAGEVAAEATPVLNTTDPEECGRLHTLDDLVVDERTRGVRDVIAILRPSDDAVATPTASPPAEPFVLDNLDCRFSPRTAVLPVGTVLEAKNSDEVLHTVHIYGPKEKNLALPLQGSSASFSLEQPGLYPVRCDVHGWMQATIRVVDGPFYAVSDDRGRFEIGGVPDGEYSLELWHERLGSLTRMVRAEEGRVAAVKMSYPGETR